MRNSPLGDPKAGDSVQVMANVDSAHNYIAIIIVKLGPMGPPGPGTIELRGFVKSISPTEWTIGGPSAVRRARSLPTISWWQ